MFIVDAVSLETLLWRHNPGLKFAGRLGHAMDRQVPLQRPSEQVCSVAVATNLPDQPKMAKPLRDASQFNVRQSEAAVAWRPATNVVVGGL